jgi:hypothetical protein
VPGNSVTSKFSNLLVCIVHNSLLDLLYFCAVTYYVSCSSLLVFDFSLSLTLAECLFSLSFQETTIQFIEISLLRNNSHLNIHLFKTCF